MGVVVDDDADTTPPRPRPVNNRFRPRSDHIGHTEYTWRFCGRAISLYNSRISSRTQAMDHTVATWYTRATDETTH